MHHPVSYGITHCYMPPNTDERAVPYHNQTGWYLIYLSHRDGKLS